MALQLAHKNISGLYCLAISSNALYVVRRNEFGWALLESIVEGSDQGGYVLEFQEVNDMLDTLTLLKKILLEDGIINLNQLNIVL